MGHSFSGCAPCNFINYIDSIFGCVRLGNPDLDFENLNPDFPIEREIRKRISPPRNPSSGWISIKKSKSGFFGFHFYRSVGKIRKKDLQNYSREQRSSFY